MDGKETEDAPRSTAPDIIRALPPLERQGIYEAAGQLKLMILSIRRALSGRESVGQCGDRTENAEQ